MNLGRYAEEVEELDKLLVKWPRDHWARFQLGVACRKLRLHQRSIDSFRTCLELQPGDANAQGNIAGVPSEMGRYEDAVAEYAKALELDPKQPRLRAQLGWCHLDNQRHEKAIVSFSTALELMEGSKEQDPVLYTRFWRAYAMRACGDIEKALAEQQALARDATEDASGSAEIALLLAMLGRFDEAREPLDAAVRFETRPPCNGRNESGAFVQGRGDVHELPVRTPRPPRL